MVDRAEGLGILRLSPDLITEPPQDWGEVETWRHKQNPACTSTQGKGAGPGMRRSRTACVWTLLEEGQLWPAVGQGHWQRICGGCSVLAKSPWRRPPEPQHRDWTTQDGVVSTTPGRGNTVPPTSKNWIADAYSAHMQLGPVFLVILLSGSLHKPLIPVHQKADRRNKSEIPWSPEMKTGNSSLGPSNTYTTELTTCLGYFVS